MEWQIWNMWSMGAWNFSRYAENPSLIILTICAIVAALFFPIFGDRLFPKLRYRD